MSSENTSFLHHFLSQPSAPYREHHPIEAARAKLKEAGVPYFQDPVGNLVVGVASKKEYLSLMHAKTTEPLRIFVAHMDHPGFHGVKWLNETHLAFEWHGGSPVERIEGARVWLADREGYAGEGLILAKELTPTGRSLKSGVIEVTQIGRDRAKTKAGSLSGGFLFRAPVWQEGDLLYTKAADDLVGAYAAMTAMMRSWPKKKSAKKPPCLALLTRAEEVGFIGTIGHLELGWWKKARRPLVCVSLETSRTLPGAEIGKGPVVRLGDRAGVFHSAYTHLFSKLAEKILPNAHQRRIMDAGTCEGTAFTAYGIPTIAISVPLGNYHNQSFQGGPDSAGENGPAPEFVHIQDLEGLLTLCHALIQPGLDWMAPYTKVVQGFRKNFKDAKGLLAAGP